MTVVIMMATMMLAQIMRIIALIMTMTHVTVIAISTATVDLISNYIIKNNYAYEKNHFSTYLLDGMYCFVCTRRTE